MNIHYLFLQLLNLTVSPHNFLPQRGNFLTQSGDVFSLLVVAEILERKDAG